MGGRRAVWLCRGNLSFWAAAACQRSHGPEDTCASWFNRSSCASRHIGTSVAEGSLRCRINALDHWCTVVAPRLDESLLMEGEQFGQVSCTAAELLRWCSAVPSSWVTGATD